MIYKATALMSCYNSKEFMYHKLMNLEEQQEDIQVIIIDCNNGENLKDIPIKNNYKIVIHEKRISLWKAINQAISISDSEYVFQSNCDDLLCPNAISKQINGLDEGNDIIYFDYCITSGYFNNWKEAVKNSYSSYQTPDLGYSTGCGLGMFPMWRKSLHSEVGMFDERLEIYGDSLFWHKLKEHNKKFKRIPEILGIYAQRDGHNLESNKELSNNDLKILSTNS